MTTKSKAAAIAATALCLTFSIPGALRAQERALSVQLEAPTPQVRAQDAPLIRFTIRNGGAETVRVLKWGTPLEGQFNGSYFRVEKDGKEVPYIGRMVKRENPSEADFQAIAPGGTASAELDLSQGYALGSAGRYLVRLRSLELATDKRTFTTLRESSANAAAIELLEARKVPQLAETRLHVLTLEQAKQATKAKAASFEGCSATQQTQADEALSHAASLAAGAYLSLAITPIAKRPAAPRYHTWFGAHTTSRYDTVTSHFQNIQSALANETVTFHCDCNDAGVYAYVYPTQPYHIHLCPVFWTTTLDGTDSRAGTLVHETSHFNVVAGTDDHAYGQSNAKNLAVNNPDNAVDNADNHEYFAENNPAEPMGSDALLALLALVVAAILAERMSRRRQRRST